MSSAIWQMNTSSSTINITANCALSAVTTKSKQLPGFLAEFTVRRTLGAIRAQHKTLVGQFGSPPPGFFFFELRATSLSVSAALLEDDAAGRIARAERAQMPEIARRQIGAV